ncbi:MAG: nitronate monooxygenase [Clostridia bacterium]|nr:nitronate monooxygenase [Clostridia bacterium]
MAKLSQDARQALRTRICERLGIEYPIFQAGMGFVARGELAAAVSEAGGLGCIGAGHLTLDELRDAIRVAKERTSKPFAVDILFAQVANPEDSRSVRYTQEVEEQIDLVLKEKVPVLVSGLGSPRAVLDEAHRRDMVVMSVVGNVRQAVRLASEGVDVIIAQGHEAGGHTGRVGSVALLPAVVDAVSVPVLAAGGFVDGRGLVAALALGASGVWMGTRFVATREAYAHERYKERIVAIDEEGTVVSRGHSGKPCRMIRNAFTDYWAAHESEIQPYPLQLLAVGREASRRARIEGDVDNGVCPAGQGSALIREVKGAGEVVRDIVAEAVEVLERGIWKR